MKLVKRLLAYGLTVAAVAVGTVAVSGAPAMAASCYARGGFAFQTTGTNSDRTITVWHGSACTGTKILGAELVLISSLNDYELFVDDFVCDPFGIQARMWYSDGSGQLSLATTGCKTGQAKIISTRLVGNPFPNNWWIFVGGTTNSDAYPLPLILV